MANIGAFTDMGPCNLSWNGPDATNENLVDYDLGEALTGTRIFYEEEQSDLRKGRTGTTIVNQLITGAQLRLECDLTLPDDAATTTPQDYGLGKLAALLSHAKFVEGVVTEAFLPDNQMYIQAPYGLKKDTGTAATSHMGALTITPFVNNALSTDDTQTWIIPAAAPMVNMELPFDFETQQVINVVFNAFPVSVANTAGTPLTTTDVLMYNKAVKGTPNPAAE